MTITFVREHLQDIVDEVCDKNDQEGELKIRKADFLNVLQHEDASGLFNQVRVDILAIFDLADTIFATETGAERVLTFPDLIEVMLDQRSTEVQTVKDIMDMRRYFHRRIETTEKSYNAAFFALGATLEKSCGFPQGAYEEEVAQVFKERRAERMLQKQQRAQARDPRTSIHKARMSHREIEDDPGTSDRALHADIRRNSDYSVRNSVQNSADVLQNSEHIPGTSESALHSDTLRNSDRNSAAPTGSPTYDSLIPHEAPSNTEENAAPLVRRSGKVCRRISRKTCVRRAKSKDPNLLSQPVTPSPPGVSFTEEGDTPCRL